MEHVGSFFASCVRPSFSVRTKKRTQKQTQHTDFVAVSLHGNRLFLYFNTFHLFVQNPHLFIHTQ